MMKKLQTLSTRSFLCHLLASSTTSFLDVLLKNGVIVYAAFRTDMTTSRIELIATLAWTVFILPFFIFSAHGGYLGDRYDKRKVFLSLRTVEMVLAVVAAFGFITGNIGLLLMLVFAKGISSALFNPLKYALLSEFLPLSMLATASSLLEAGTMIAMLGGTYMGAVYGADKDPSRIGMIAIVATTVALLATWFAPKSTGGSRAPLSIGFNPLKPTFAIIKLAFTNRGCLAAILALSWYWALGAVYLSNVTPLVRTLLSGNENLVASILLIFTLGIGFGLAIGSMWLHGKPNTRIANAMALSMALAGAGLYMSIPDSLLPMQGYFFIIALASGVYAVHFSAVLHFNVDHEIKARIFAAYTIMSSLLAVVALLTSTWLLHLGIPLSLCLAGFAAATLPLTFLLNSMIR